jgi:sugar phosphate isomerase/epimerase
MPSVHLSGFADEAANQKLALQQFCALSALGMEYYTLRFIDLGNGIKNVMLLDEAELDKLLALQKEYGLAISSIGSPIGKVKLLDVDDGTTNRFVPFKEYLEKDVQRACNIANKLETKLLRGFSFYHPKGDDPQKYVSQAADQLGQIAELVDREGLTFGLEVEANLVGQTGKLLRSIYDAVNHPAMLLIFDGANLVCQGMTTQDVYEEYEAMKPGLGWLHIKDYRTPATKASLAGGVHVDEDSLKNFVPVDKGDSGHEKILKDFVSILPAVEQRMTKRGVPGVFLDLEPHLKGGGQFGGFSGPDGFGVALRSLCKLLDKVGIDYPLRSYETLVRN